MSHKPPASSASSPAWECLAEHAPFSRRDTAEDAVFLDKMWISNAYVGDNDKAERDLWNSADGRNWTKVLDQTPYDSYSEMAVFRGKLWAIKASVWNTSDGVNWTKVLDQTPFGPRGYGEVVVFQDKLWQLGSGEDVWCSGDGIRWTRVLDKAPFGPRVAAAVAAYGGQLWLCGGYIPVASDPPEMHYAQFTTFNDVWTSADGVNWQRVLEHAPWSPRMWFIAREYAQRLWLIGGFSNRQHVNFAECWTSTDGLKWDSFQPAPPWTPRHEPTVYVFDKSLWVVAGNSWPLMNDVWRLTLPR